MVPCCSAAARTRGQMQYLIAGDRPRRRLQKRGEWLQRPTPPDMTLPPPGGLFGDIFLLGFSPNCIPRRPTFDVDLEDCAGCCSTIAVLGSTEYPSLVIDRSPTYTTNQHRSTRNGDPEGSSSLTRLPSDSEENERPA